MKKVMNFRESSTADLKMGLLNFIYVITYIQLIYTRTAAMEQINWSKNFMLLNNAFNSNVFGRKVSQA